ncbi:protein outspread isoform X2 [Bacillus rossius redtenbacheri]|uniref:protein outspread isoform X2 n=1 Tax=Bacillus rossius redtenbacheri TaxID=93214 RepID=UPI002FDD3F2D
MSSSLMRSECRKFSPNIFNKSKCTNCFKQKEEHSAEALESNRATRKVAKCGYLFVAPGWDFSNPLNRTKRWQRRWFVLYDDGELSYSVDEHPDTVPQASIDMNKVLEVTDAEEVTGNAFSLAVTAPDRVHFVKGTCREECRWWADVLSVFPRSKGRHKRNATFPGGQTTSILQQSPAIRACTPSDSRPRFNSCHTDPAALRQPPTQPWLPVEADAFPTRDVPPSPPQEARPEPAAPAVDTSAVYRDQPASSASPPTRDKVQTEEKIRTRRVLNREKRGVKSARSYSEDFSGMLPTWKDTSTATETQDKNDVSRRILFDDYENESKRDEKLKDIADSITRPRYRRNNQSHITVYHSSVSDRVKPTRDGEYSEEEQKKVYTRSGSPVIREVDHTDGCTDKLVRGDPDGCGLDISSHRYSPNSELRVDLPAEDLLNIKKGWLMKQGVDKEWNKHWFVLRGSALMYYRDPTAEDKGIMDGVIDLSGVKSVVEVQVARNYGFQAVTWDDKRHVLSAVTSGIRGNWMLALRRAAGLQNPSPTDSSLTVGEKLERELDNISMQSVCVEREPSIVPSTPVTTPRSILFSSDEEYRTASEGGRRESEDWGESLAPLPPSPPLNRTPISRVKEKARSRVYKRSRSSPPSSRRSTLDSVRTEDLILGCCGELPESDAEGSVGMDSVQSSLYTAVGSQSSEVDDLKTQLSMALCEVSNAEEELLRLRHHKTEIIALEKQVKDLLTTLDRTEEQLKQRTKEASEAELLRKRFNELAREHEELLADWRKKAMDKDWRALYQQLEERYREDSEKWKDELKDQECACEEAKDRCRVLSLELASSQEAIEHLRGEVIGLGERLARGIEENESLYRRLRELEGRGGAGVLSSSSRERGRSVDSLSDLTNIDLDLDLTEMDKERIMEEYDDLRGRFEKAVQEIRAMKRELRESHALYDELELSCIKLRQDAKLREDDHSAQFSLMVRRVDDLTLKLSAAEKQVRSLKQKLAKADSRDKRRSLSLKGRESFQICKELEEKLGELESKISALESGKPITAVSIRTSKHARSESPQGSKKDDSGDKLKASSSRLRRKSLDSATSSEPMKVLIRLTSLEAKVTKAAEQMSKCKSEDAGAKEVEVSLDDGPEPMDFEDGNSDLMLRLHILEQAVLKSKAKLTECVCLLQSLKSASPARHSLLSQTPQLTFLENNLLEVKQILQNCDSRCSSSEMNSLVASAEEEAVKSSVQSVVSRFEELLREKLSELFKKRMNLKQSGQLDKTARTKLLAEKLAYESVLISRIAQAVACSGEGSQHFKISLLGAEVLECNRLFSVLKSKLNGSTPPETCETSVNYLTRVLSHKLLLQGQLKHDSHSSPPVNKAANSSNSDALRLMLDQQRDCEACIDKYRNEKLNHLAKTLAIETLSVTDKHEPVDEVQNWKSEKRQSPKPSALTLEDQRIREAWMMAQEAVNQELIQAEISHVTMRCGQAYEAALSSEQETRFTLLAAQRVVMEQWYDTAEEILRQEMEAGIEELNARYEECLSRLKNEKAFIPKSHHEEESMESRHLLFEFADIMAHKALIDARIAVISREAQHANLSNSRAKENVRSVVQSVLENEMMSSRFSDYETSICNVDCELGSEFEFLFQQYLDQCCLQVASVGCDKLRTDHEQAGQVMGLLSELEEELNLLQDDARSEKMPSCHGDSKELTWSDVCDKCKTLRQIIANLSARLKDIRICKRCQQLQESIKRLSSDHEEEVRMLRRCQEDDMLRLRGELEQQRHSLVSQHEQEQAHLKERARLLERRLGTLDSEYSQQVENLRSAYQKTLTAGLERDIEGEENIRQRYQAEIEQLRALCEKGLVAMENSHRRIIAELDEKHRQELEQLRLEKEQALAEETQATLAALDAMRKAHETEVQREIVKFKNEFIKKMQSTHDIGALHKEHEAEMEEIKKEILSLSERYSVKCVESAALEEQLAVVTKQLTQAQQHVQQLDARNKQLRAHLVSEVSELETGDTAQLLRQRDQELVKKQEELGQLQRELSTARAHGEELITLCSQLSNEHSSQRDRAAVWARLQKLAATCPSLRKGLKAIESSRPKSDCGVAKQVTSSRFKQQKEPPTLTSAELIRSPEQNISRSERIFLSLAPLRSPSPCPLSGMVAERKKMFEH